MNLTNQEVEFLFSWLNIPLHGEELRSRNKFIKLIEDQHLKTQEKRVTMLNEAAEKDENGKPIFEESGHYKLTDENTQKFGKEFNSFLKDSSQLYSIEGTEMKKYVEDIKTLLLERMVKGLDIEEGKIYDAILEELESVVDK
jgi:hypothetical protein